MVSLDQTGRKVQLNDYPTRIISLVPSQTELLYDLGLRDEVIGITKFCVHPDEWFRTKKRVGGTKQVNFAAVHDLKPDLIIANKEENVKDQVEELAKHYPVWVSDINSLEDAHQMIEQVGDLVDKKEAAIAITKLIREKFSQLPPVTHRPRAAYFIWRNPYMAAGGDTFIHAMMESAGFENIFTADLRYPETTLDILKQKGCECLLLSSEPFPFNEKHVREIQPQLPDVRIILVDGEMFSWYGSRLVLAADYFREIR